MRKAKSRWISLVLLLSSTGLCSCSNYTKVELTKDNFLDYFVRLESGFFDEAEKIDATHYIEKDKKDCCLSAMFYIPEENLTEKYYSHVFFEVKLNLYKGITEIKEDSEPDSCVNFISHLHYLKTSDGVFYYIGATLSYSDFSYYPESGDNIKIKSDQVSSLETNYEKNEFEYTDYLREFVITSVSGEIQCGGLTSLNTYHCDK